MASTPFLLTLLFLVTLSIPPIPSFQRGHLTPSALGFPVALSFIPRSAFTTPTPRSWEVARALQGLVTVWVGMGAVRGMKRTWRRIRGGSIRLNEPADTATQTSFMDSPLLTAIPLHLLSWRLATTLILPDLPEAWKWPFDATTLIGTGVGLIISWAEVWGLFVLLGFGGSSESTRKIIVLMTGTQIKGGRIRKMVAIGLGLYRLYLSVRVLGATFDTTGGVGKAIPPLPSHVPA